MSILEKEVSMRLSGSNISQYEKIGYKIPRTVNKHGKLTVPFGTEIMVKVEDLIQSKIKVTKICDDCGKITPHQKHSDIIRSRIKGDGRDRCYDCARIIGGHNRRNNVKYENSFEYWTKQNNKEYLLTEFSEKNERKPFELSHGNGDLHLWNCRKCKSEYNMTLSNRKSGNICPYCSGWRVNHTNCLWATHPEVAKLLKKSERGYEITYGKHTTEVFICPNCDHEQLKKLANVVFDKFYCLNCSDGISYPEKFTMNMLCQLNVNFERQKVFEWNRNVYNKLSQMRKYDFFIQSLNCIIETHGKQHYESSFEKLGGRDLEEEQENDRLKETMAINNKIENYIVIDCRNSELGWIKNNILNSTLSKLFDLSGVNWLQCHEFACKSLVKVACELWNSGSESTIEIGKVLKLDKTTIRKYLKQGTEIGWCDYNPKEVQRKNGTKKLNAKKVMQLTESGEYIKEWNSITDAAEELELKINGIYSAVNKNNRTYKGFKWAYIEVGAYDEAVDQS